MEPELLEILCKQFYESQDAQLRVEAEKALYHFQDDPEALSKCQTLLDRANSSFSQLFATTILTKLVTKNIQVLRMQQRVDIRNYVLNYLATRPNLQPFVIQALISLLVKITKLCWIDMYEQEYVFQNILQDVKEFLGGSVDHCVIGVQILSQLTVEMNQQSESACNLTFPKHLRITSLYRDKMLYEIFILACTLLSQAKDSVCKNLNCLDEAQQGLFTHLLELARNCLSYDFVGATADESSDDIATVQIPTNWRPAFLDSESDSLKLFFDLYHMLPTRLSSLALSCLAQITSIRRSIFSNSERIKFLTKLVKGATDILKTSHGLSDPDNYHEFCRLLARLKSNYQLSELVIVENYPEAIQLIAKFTVQSLQMWQSAPNSIHYLLSLWQRLIASLPYVKSPEPHYLETYTPEVTKAFITSKLDAVPVIVREGLEDPVDDTDMVQQQLEQFATIGRCEYDKTCALLVQLFDQTANRYQEILSSPSTANHIDLQICEGQLTWLVYIIGASIGGRIATPSFDDHDVLECDIIIRVLQLMTLTDSRLPQCGCEKLELAFMYFLAHVRKIYITEHMQKLKMFPRLSEILGVSDDDMTMLTVTSRKIITNLKYLGNSEMVLRKTLALLNDLTLICSSVRKLIKLDEIQFMLNNRTREHFSFLGSGTVAATRCRSMFYTCLGRLLMMDLGEDVERFNTFMMPLTKTIENIIMMNFPSEEAKKELIGLSRDLRGLALAFNAKMPYMMLFDWIYPDYSPILIRAVQMWAHDPTVTTPVLKLFTELVYNRSQRLLFDVSSPNGILLFRETSKLICCYGESMLSLNVPKEQMYPMKLKGISVCFQMLKQILSGNYVNFGVFKLYGDNALDNVLNMTAKLILTIPHDDILVYPKLSLSYYTLIQCLAQDHISYLSTLEPPLFLYILESISQGLNALESVVCSCCCQTLDHIVTYIFKQLQLNVSTFPNKKHRQAVPPENNMFLKVMELHPEILQGLLSTMMNIVMFEDCKHHWSMSRPLLVLILLYEDCFRRIRETVIQSQPVAKQQNMARLFEMLMDGIERNLLIQNRDKFTQNLLQFRRDINASLKITPQPNSTANEMDD
ncbi:AGAP004535-PA [Anopheles gambiae str. PEST]|uniref:AGAP004535-PA n=2 Tax=gambiae species complex TaxID=44542 RepID=Q7PQ84_ANOGA|nr:ran-binding protein 16 [Anopheles coluzzii]EAA09181.6 AGAP004535-PA [Anopheles gambiae str. PEST]